MSAKYTQRRVGMSGREDLIEEAAKAIFAATGGYLESDENGANAARAALTVFEKALPPIANHPWSIECGLCQSGAHIQQPPLWGAAKARASECGENLSEKIREFLTEYAKEES